MSLINAQNDSLTVNENYSNLAIFITDFISNDFEGAVVHHLAGNNTENLLFKINYQSPSDFGSIEFKHLPSNKIVFKGGIVHDGLGEIEIPANFIEPSVFIKYKRSVKRPKQYQYYEYSTEFKSFREHPKIMVSELSMIYGKKGYCEEFEEINNSEDFFNLVWKSIANLKVVNDFIQKNCKVGFYLYTPAVGMFDPTEAKWITFLYLN